MAKLLYFRKVPNNAFWGGFIDYNDLATQTTPISVTGGAWFVYLPNDEQWPFTNKAYKPANINDVWDASLNQFDWTELKNWDMVDIRVDLQIVTSAPNTNVELFLEIATGAGTYDIPFLENQYKTAWTHIINRFNGIYMGDDNTRLNPSKFKIKADSNITVQVNWWYCKIIERSEK